MPAFTGNPVLPDYGNTGTRTWPYFGPMHVCTAVEIGPMLSESWAYIGSLYQTNHAFTLPMLSQFLIKCIYHALPILGLCLPSLLPDYGHPLAQCTFAPRSRLAQCILGIGTMLDANISPILPSFPIWNQCFPSSVLPIFTQHCQYWTNANFCSIALLHPTLAP